MKPEMMPSEDGVGDVKKKGQTTKIHGVPSRLEAHSGPKRAFVLNKRAST
jgi:hypothetical protein